MFRLTVDTNADGQLNSSVPGPSEQGDQSVTCQFTRGLPSLLTHPEPPDLSLVDVDGPNWRLVAFVRLVLQTRDYLDSFGRMESYFLRLQEYFGKEILFFKQFQHLVVLPFIECLLLSRHFIGAAV